MVCDIMSAWFETTTLSTESMTVEEKDNLIRKQFPSIAKYEKDNGGFNTRQALKDFNARSK